MSAGGALRFCTDDHSSREMLWLTGWSVKYLTLLDRYAHTCTHKGTETYRMEGHANEGGGVNRNAQRGDELIQNWVKSYSDMLKETDAQSCSTPRSPSNSPKMWLPFLCQFPSAEVQASFKAVRLKSLAVSTPVLVLLCSCSDTFPSTSSQTRYWS